MKEINELLAITAKLKKRYKRGFTLDGKLVGDIGEVLVAEAYGLILYDENKEKHDGFVETEEGRKKVQIKASFSKRSYFPTKHVPNYYIAVQLNEDGTFVELFNGPGRYVKQFYIDDVPRKNGGQHLYTLSGNKLLVLNKQLKNEDPSQPIERVR